MLFPVIKVWYGLYNRLYNYNNINNNLENSACCCEKDFVNHDTRNHIGNTKSCQ